ncbi:hypothetical protein GCM10022295_28080 [Streptomyces osmaniensis]|uniref:Uncharacterized protein n=1 Tax=Streptomyces osmaniensis TaxID=593134 RepID=A0ABP6W0Q9_9ACTN
MVNEGLNLPSSLPVGKTVRIGHTDPRLADWVGTWNRLARLEKQRRQVLASETFKP